MAPLRLNATISDGRITVFFSHKASATMYDNYLQRLGDGFYEKQKCKFAESGDEISMELPVGITAEPVNTPKDVELSFNGEEEALAWEHKMILWKYKLPEAYKLRLSRALTVEHFADEIAAQETMAHVAVSPVAMSFHNTNFPDTQRAAFHTVTNGTWK